MTEEQTTLEEKPSGITPVVEPPSSHGMIQQQNVTGQMPVTSFPGVHSAQPPPPQYYYPQHPPQNPYVVAGQYNQQISEFTVPADPNRAPTQIIVAQPQMLQPPVYVPDEMALSIFTTLCCGLCFGIPAMIFASEANSLRNIDPERALAKAKVARSLNVTAIILGVVAIVISMIVRFAVQTY